MKAEGKICFPLGVGILVEYIIPSLTVAPGGIPLGLKWSNAQQYTRLLYERYPTGCTLGKDLIGTKNIVENPIYNNNKSKLIFK